MKGKFPYQDITYYLIAFIDDCSRKIMYYETGIFKDMTFTSNALANCCSKVNPSNWPFELTTDNGMEFKGKDFEDGLKQHGILHYYIRPRNPEENAKIERWWQHIEKLESYQDIGIVVELYNNTLYHSALTPYLGQKSTPANAYDMLPKFDIDRDGIFNQLEFTP